MQRVDINNPTERKKLIWAVALGVVAIVFLWWTFIGFGGGSKTKPARVDSVPSASPASQRAANQTQPQSAVEIKGDLLNQLQPIPAAFQPLSVPDAKRNIFAYYEPPLPAQPVPPTPTPTPIPPVLLATVSPSSVYARTSDFSLEVTGDKFTPAIRIMIDGGELPTRYISPQQLSATVPAALIANPGVREIALRSPDGKLFSNPVVLNVAAPPTPNYSYIGIIGTPRHLDTAILQDRANKEVLNAQRGDVLGGRFRVTSISEKELVLVDTSLKIKHTVPFSTDGEKTFTPPLRPTPEANNEDDEP
jgi:hypothetical protein